MALTKAEQDSLEALRRGATLAEAVALLPDLTPQQLAQLDENGDYIPSSSSSVLNAVERSAPVHPRSTGNPKLDAELG